MIVLRCPVGRATHGRFPRQLIEYTLLQLGQFVCAVAVHATLSEVAARSLGARTEALKLASFPHLMDAAPG